MEEYEQLWADKSPLDIQTIKNTKRNAYIGLDTLTTVREDDDILEEKELNIIDFKQKYASSRSVEGVTPIGPNLCNLSFERSKGSASGSSDNWPNATLSTKSMSTTFSEIGFEKARSKKATKKVQFKDC